MEKSIISQPRDLPSLTVVIPVLNEEKIISATSKRVLETLKKMVESKQISNGELIVVDDGSTDSTAENTKTVKGVTLISHNSNQGYGAALKTGFHKANTDYLSFLDSDGTYPVEEIPLLLKSAIESNADMVVGTRMTSKESKMPFTRKIGNTFFAALLSFLSHTKVTDSASGLRILKRNIFLNLPGLPDGLNFTPALSARCLCMGLKVIEYPISYSERIGDSKLSAFKDGLRFLKSIVTIVMLYNPMKFFSFVGLILLFSALYLGIDPVNFYFRAGSVPDIFMPKLIGVLTFTAAGINVISFGVLTNLILELTSGIKAPKSKSEKLLYNFLGSRFHWAALIFFTAGITLLTHSFYIYYKGTQCHWSFWLTSAFLTLAGLEMLSFCLLIKIIRSIKRIPV